jgi:hypothetical protein
MDDVPDADHQPVSKAEFRASQAEFRSSQREFRDELRSEFRALAITLAHHTAELADIRGYMKDKLVTRDEFHSRMDEHERRISALEKKPS